MKWLKRLAVLLGVIILILAVVPFFITFESPLLYPTGGTVAGTAVLGPGVGTAVGARIGQWFENLFGKKEEEKQ